MPHSPQPAAGDDFVDWLFMDLNSYFASVEQETRPELRGRPVGVVPLETDHTCCIAASYEAKNYGVKTGTGVAEARQLCPHIAIVTARPKLYVEYHHRIVEAVNACVPVSIVMSVDEMACRLIGRERRIENASRIAMEVKQAIRGVGSTLRCSVGLAPNRYLAKMAGDMMKPDGLTVLLKRDLPQALYPLKLTDVLGVSRNMAARLNFRGVNTVEQLCALPPERMRRIWGSVVGERVCYWLRGMDFEIEPGERKSLGKQHVLGPELRSPEQCYRVAQKLLQTVAANLRKRDLWAGAIGGFVEFVDSRYGSNGRAAYGRRERASAGRIEPWKAGMRIQQCRDTFTLLRHLETLWRACPDYKPLQVGVWLYDLTPDAQHTLNLFDANCKQLKLSETVDAINDKYGVNSVYFAGVQNVRSSAPTRIAFSSVPEVADFARDEQ